MSQQQSSKRERNLRLFNFAIIGMLGQVGIFTLLILLAALFIGLRIDGQMNTRPLFTLTFLVVSIPVSLIVMLVIVRQGLARIRPGIEKPGPSQNEETGFGKNA